MVKKIAVLRANALGDFIFVLPALQALRETFPEAEIVYLGRDWHKQFLDGRPSPVDRVIVVPPYQGISESEGFIPDPDILDAFFAEMQKEEFDMAFQLHGGGRNSNPFVLRLGAKTTIGLKTPDAADLDISVPYVYYHSEILRYLEVVAKVGAVTASIEPSVTVTKKDLDEAKRILGNFKGDETVVIHPGASDLRRRWPPENFASIADFMAEKGFTVYLSGMPFERDHLNAIESKVQQKSKVHNLCGKLPLDATTGLLSASRLLISNDTGPLHLARAVKTPTVGIYWCGNIVTGLPVTTGIHRPLLSFAISCPLCGLSSKHFGKETDRGPCKHETSFVADVSVDEVKSAIEELLDLGSLKSAELNFTQSSKITLEKEEA